MNRFERQALYSWVFIAALTGLTLLLAVLQYRWIGEVSRAEEDRLKANLTASLTHLSDEFNANIMASYMALLPAGDEKVDEQTYLDHFRRWRDANKQQERLFGNIVRLIPAPKQGGIQLRQLDPQRMAFRTIDWPASWGGLREEMLAQVNEEDPPRHPPRTERFDQIVVPVFGNRTPEEWVVFEIDPNFLRTVLMPELMDRLTHAVGPGYQAELVSRADGATVLYQSDPESGTRIGASADGQVPLVDLRPRQGPPPNSPIMTEDRGAARGKWLLSVRHQSGSLEALVARTRLRNIGVTTAVLALILLAIGALVRFTQRAQTLGRLQMEFVAGVSHELRTPLTVIRTAAHNLSAGIVKSGDLNQVQKYGRLIGGQAEKLSGLVEQVLRFANAEAGRVISRREPIAVEALIDETLAGCETMIAESRCEVEKSVAGDCAPLWGDAAALRHGLQNLVINAAKYGADGRWIGIRAAMADGPKQQQVVEIRVADRGAGIPEEERRHIFEPFFRGQRAMDDQVHGTGLGLALVKRIVEAHGGTVEVCPSAAGSRGTEFAVKLPPAPPEQIDEFADITS